MVGWVTLQFISFDPHIFRTLRVDRPTTKKRLLAMQDALGTGEEVEEEVKVEMKEEMKEGGVNRDLAPDNQVPDASSKSPKPRFSEAEDAGIPKTSSSNEPASSVTGGGNLGVRYDNYINIYGGDWE